MWISNLCLGAPQYEPMYHIQKIRWAQEYPLTPGLANLHSHFGFDSSMFLMIAFFDYIINFSITNFSGYLLTLCFLYFFIIPFYIICENKSRLKGSILMRLLITPLIVYFCFYRSGSTNTDLFSSFFGLFVAVNLFELIIEEKKDFIFFFLNLVLGFSAKLSFLPILILSVIVLLLNRSKFLEEKTTRPKIFFFVFIIGISLQLHRNIILTGYPLYPRDFLPFPVKWKVPPKNIKLLNNVLDSFPVGLPEMNPNYHQDKKDWLKGRFLIQHRRIETLYPTLFGIGGLLLTVKRKKIYDLIKIIIFAIPAFGQILFFLILAPDGRFANFAFWWFGAGCLSQSLKDIFLDKQRNLIAFAIFILFFSFSIHSFDRLGKELPLVQKDTKQELIKSPPYNLFTTDSGLRLKVPKNNKNCHDCPIPCTDKPNKKLKLLKKGVLSKGFYID